MTDNPPSYAISCLIRVLRDRFRASTHTPGQPAEPWAALGASAEVSSLPLLASLAALVAVFAALFKARGPPPSRPPPQAGLTPCWLLLGSKRRPAGGEGQRHDERVAAELAPPQQRVGRPRPPHGPAPVVQLAQMTGLQIGRGPPLSANPSTTAIEQFAAARHRRSSAQLDDASRRWACADRRHASPASRRSAGPKGSGRRDRLSRRVDGQEAQAVEYAARAVAVGGARAPGGSSAGRAY